MKELFILFNLINPLFMFIFKHRFVRIIYIYSVNFYYFSIKYFIKF